MGADGAALFAGDVWFNLIEAGTRGRVGEFIEELIGKQLDVAPGRRRYKRDAEALKDSRNGTHERRLLGLFGALQISVLQARIAAKGGISERRSALLSRYAWMIKQIEALTAVPNCPAPTLRWSRLIGFPAHHVYYAASKTRRRSKSKLAWPIRLTIHQSSTSFWFSAKVAK